MGMYGCKHCILLMLRGESFAASMDLFVTEKVLQGMKEKPSNHKTKVIYSIQNHK